MDKSLLIFIAIGLGALYLVTNFIGDIQAEDDASRNKDYVIAHKYDQYKSVDSIGHTYVLLYSPYFYRPHLLLECHQ